MRKGTVWLFLAWGALVLGFGISCRQPSESRGEQVAERLGRDEAVYVTSGAPGRTETVLGMDLTKLDKPANPAGFIQFFHFPPGPPQGPEVCWSSAMVSFLESEVRRQGRTPVRLSEIYLVYWDCVEKTRMFVGEKGEFGLIGLSEPDFALEIFREHGIVRKSDYPGLDAARPGAGRLVLAGQIRDFLGELKERRDWDEGRAVAGVRAILDRGLGKPPEKIVVDGRSLTPLEYLRESLGLDPSDYVSFISFKYLPPYTEGEYRTPGNWSHSRDYFNLPLYDFRLSLLGALRRGFTAVLAVDSSKPFYAGENGLAFVPSFDIPQNFIDASSREFRFVSAASSGDHAVHCVGYTENKAVWYLIKDTLENAGPGSHPGYVFCRDDFIKLKCLSFLVHKEAVKEVLARFPSR